MGGSESVEGFVNPADALASLLPTGYPSRPRSGEGGLRTAGHSFGTWHSTRERRDGEALDSGYGFRSLAGRAKIAAMCDSDRGLVL